MSNEGKKATGDKAAGKKGDRVAASVGKSTGRKTKSGTSKAVAKRTQRVPVTPNVETLIGKAITKGQLDVVERLMAMRRELKAEAATEAYFQDLAAFQKECPIIRKSIDVLNKKEKGGGVRYRYAPIDEIEEIAGPLLAKHGFSYVFKSKQGKGQVKAILEAHHRMGHVETTELAVPIQQDAYMTAPQKVASALTFAKRYVFCNGFGIVTGDVDDDGRSAGVRSENGAKERDVSPKRQEPQTLGLDKMPEDAQQQVEKFLAKMKWLPDNTKDMYRNQAAEFIKKGDLKSLRGLAQSLSRQMAMKKQEAQKK